MKSKKLYSVKDCVNAWGISKRTVIRMMHKGMGDLINGKFYTTRLRVRDHHIELANLL